MALKQTPANNNKDLVCKQYRDNHKYIGTKRRPKLSASNSRQELPPLGDYGMHRHTVSTGCEHWPCHIHS